MWILTQIEFRCGATTYLSSTVALTVDDLAEVRLALEDVASGRREHFIVDSTDADFALVAERAPSQGDIFLGFWVGEPYNLMQGYRFVSTTAAVKEFVGHLKDDEGADSPPGTSS